MKNKIVVISIFIIAVLIGVFIGYSFTAYEFRKRAPFLRHKKIIEHQRRAFIQMMKPLVEKGARDRFLLRKAIIDGDTSRIDSFVEVISQDEREIIKQVTHHLLIITKDLPERDRGRLIDALVPPHRRPKKGG